MPRIFMIALLIATFLAAPAVFGPAMPPSLSASAQAAGGDFFLKLDGIPGDKAPSKSGKQHRQGPGPAGHGSKRFGCSPT
jgi:hypothetical protein